MLFPFLFIVHFIVLYLPFLIEKKQFWVIKEDIVTYGFNIVKDSIDGNKSSKWATYDTVDGYWHFDPTPYSAEMSN